MSNFVRVYGQDPVNMNLVRDFKTNNGSVIWFNFENGDRTEWGFRDEGLGIRIYKMLLDNYTTTLNP